jgi:FkbH-like protein
MIEKLGAETVLRKRKGLRRELLQKDRLLDVRIAILGGSTTTEVADLLEILLLEKGIRPLIYQSSYNKYFEEAVMDPAELVRFRPDVVYVHTSSINIQEFPALDIPESQLDRYVGAETNRFAAIWSAVPEKIGGLLVQNNFELPTCRVLGNLDCVSPGGQVRFINCLNHEFAKEANLRSRFVIHDLNGIAAMVGLAQFHDPKRWYSYKIFSTPAGSLAMAQSLAAVIASAYGLTRKVLALDLDNTLWGGVIGDDGPDRIKIGKDTPEGEAYTAFQRYCLQLRDRGVILAVCSKNEEGIALQGFKHPDSILKRHHISAFRANWQPKPDNLQAIARELNIGLDSIVFVDDNPAERELVRAQLPSVAVPDIGQDVAEYANILEQYRYFETVSLSREDLNRSQQYEMNAQRAQEQSQFADYGEFLDSLGMVAEIAALKPVYLERIAQLVNKTNQFNLTTKRLTISDVERIASDPGHITLYAKLVDKFGDNGLVSVIIGRRVQEAVHLDLWLMSCRVLKRDMELAMLDSLVSTCLQQGVREIYGYYIRTEKNALVAEHYRSLGFECVSAGKEQSTWRLPLAGYTPRNKHIKELVYG